MDYFNEEEVSQAIIDYNESDDKIERSRIYNNRIKKAFSKLVEYIVNMKFDHYSTNKEDFMNRIQTHMVQKLDGFDPTKGRAFSYFNMIARNEGLRLSKKNYKHKNAYSSIDDEDYHFEPSIEEDSSKGIERTPIQVFFDAFVNHWENKIYTYFHTDESIRVAEALIDIFRKRENIERFNKRDIYVMVREQSGIDDVKYITPVVRSFRKHYEKHIKKFRKKGTIDFENDVVNEKEISW